MKKWTVEEFEKAFGKMVNDDLDRLNCEKAGEIGHWQCGYCEEHKKPRFLCGCITNKKLPKLSYCCKVLPVWGPDPYSNGGTYHCPNCYDGAPDAGLQNTASGRTQEEAIENWNEEQDAEGER